MILQGTVQKRGDFASLCNSRMIKLAVEIGTDRGAYAAEFMREWNGDQLWCVDTWQPYEHMPWDRSSDMLMAALAVAPFVGRVRFLKASSHEAAVYLQEHAVRFIYIDAAHDYESVKMDLAAWWSVLRTPGVFAGHDFDDDHHEVKRAVSEFAADLGLDVFVTHDADSPPSWYVEKV